MESSDDETEPPVIAQAPSQDNSSQASQNKSARTWKLKNVGFKIIGKSKS
jgi:hypothetical protein